MSKITEWIKANPVIAATVGAGLYGALNKNSKIGEFMFGDSKRQPIGYTGGIPEYKATRELAPNAFATTTPTGEVRRPGSVGRRYFTGATLTPTGKTMGPATTPDTGGVYNGLSEQETVEMLNNMFGSGGVGGNNLVSRGANYAGVAEQIRAGNMTPQSAATTLNTRVPGQNFTEESVVFNLLQEGLTNPQEVADYYKSRGYSAEDVLNRYQALGGTRKFASGGIASLPQARGYYLGGPTDGMADRIPATINGRQPAALSDGEFVIPADVVSHLGNGNSDAGAKQLYSMMDRVRQARTGNKQQGRKINPNKYTPA